MSFSAAADAKDVKFNLKVMMNEQNTKVLFAEAGSDFADVLISFLTTPLGSIIRTLNKDYGEKDAPAIGSVSSLYNGLANLSTDYFWTEYCKDIIVNPRNSFEAECRGLKLDVNDTKPPQYFLCENSFCNRENLKHNRDVSCNVSMYYVSAKCYVCGKPMRREVVVNNTNHYSSSSSSSCGNDGGGVFTLNKTSFIVSDDLQIFPNTTGFLQTLGKLGIADTDVGCSKNVTFGFNEIMDLLKGSLLSPTPLSDVILNNDTKVPKSEPGILFPENKSAAACSESKKKMVLRANVQESTNKLLFAQAEEDFVDFLCILLTIPLGGVECLLGGNTFFQCIDNLYSSLKDFNGDKYLATRDMKDRLIQPKLPHGYTSANQILPVTEEFVDPVRLIRLSPFESSKGQGKFVGGPRMYKISDDLTVTPFCMASILSDLKAMKIPSSDVKELELEIGSKEALSILKASLTSTCALTDGLNINAMLMSKRRK